MTYDEFQAWCKYDEFSYDSQWDMFALLYAKIDRALGVKSDPQKYIPKVRKQKEKALNPLLSLKQKLDFALGLVSVNTFMGKNAS